MSQLLCMHTPARTHARAHTHTHSPRCSPVIALGPPWEKLGNADGDPIFKTTFIFSFTLSKGAILRSGEPPTAFRRIRIKLVCKRKKKKKTNDTSAFQKRICEPTIRQQAKSGFVGGEASPQLQSLFGIDSGAWGTGILRTPGSHWVGPSGRATLCRGSCSAYVTGRQGRGLLCWE